MAHQLVRSGKEPLIREAIAYLERLGIPARSIRAVRIEGEVGQPVALSVDLFVDADVDLSGDVPLQLASRNGPVV